MFHDHSTVLAQLASTEPETVYQEAQGDREMFSWQDKINSADIELFWNVWKEDSFYHEVACPSSIPHPDKNYFPPF